MPAQPSSKAAAGTQAPRGAGGPLGGAGAQGGGLDQHRGSRVCGLVRALPRLPRVCGGVGDALRATSPEGPSPRSGNTGWGHICEPSCLGVSWPSGRRWAFYCADIVSVPLPCSKEGTALPAPPLRRKGVVSAGSAEWVGAECRWGLGSGWALNTTREPLGRASGASPSPACRGEGGRLSRTGVLRARGLRSLMLCSQSLDEALKYCNYVFTVVFVFEAALKLVAFGFRRFFKDRCVGPGRGWVGGGVLRPRSGESRAPPLPQGT